MTYWIKLNKPGLFSLEEEKKKRLGNKHLYIERTTAWGKDMLLGQEEI